MICVISATISLSDICTGREIDVRLNCHTSSFLPLILLTPDLVMSLVQVIVSTALSIYFRFYTGSASEDPEAMLVGDVVDGVDSSLVLVSIGPSHSSKSVASLLLGRVDVLVAVGNVAELILGLVLRGHHGGGHGLSHDGGRDSLGHDGGSGVGGNNWGLGHDGGGGVGGNSWGLDHGGWEGVEGGDGSSVGELGVDHRAGEGGGVWSSDSSVAGVEASQLGLASSKSQERGEDSLGYQP